MSENRIISIENVQGGFWQFFNHSLIDKTWCEYSSGTITVYYKSGVTKTILTKCSGYNSQYGTPVSDDGTKIFIGAWEKNWGIRCYSISENKLVWKKVLPGIRQIFCINDYLVVLEAGKSILKIDINSGEILATIKSKTIEGMFLLSDNLVFVNSVDGVACILDTLSMKIVKSYPNAIINPNGRKSFIINHVEYRDSNIIVLGFEADLNDSQMTPYTRVIDMNFKPNSNSK